jgi:hypothetical protein
LEGLDVLYKTNTIHISSPVLMRSIQDVIPRQRLADITSVELVCKPKQLPLDLGFTGNYNSQHQLYAGPIFPSLRYLRISFKRLTYGEIDNALGIVWPYKSKEILSHRLHDHFLPELDRLLERIVLPSTDVTVTCSKWDWYVAIDLFLMKKQGKEGTKLQRADIEGLKCWRSTPRRIEDASGVEGRRKGFWIHMCLEGVNLDDGSKFLS